METHEVQHPDLVEQNAPAPKSPLNDSDTYRMMVLRFDMSEEEVDELLLQSARELGIDLFQPPSPKSVVDEVTTDVSALEISPSTQELSETPEPSVQSSSQASESINAQSDSSIDYRRHAKSPSLTATSVTSITSITSVSSQKSNYSKVKKGFRRISTLHRHKPCVPELSTQVVRPVTQPRAATIDQVPTTVGLQPHAVTTDEPPLSFTRRRLINSDSYTPATYNARPPPPPSLKRPLLPQREISHLTSDPSEIYGDVEVVSPPSPTTVESQHRSLNHPHLKKLRTIQLQEQLRFIYFQASQTRLMRTAHLQAKRAALTAYKSRQFDLETTHADSLVSLENRHLGAEVDLRKGLEAERKGCDVRLKHMQAYCNPRSTVEGMPRREATKADYQQLEQQYHIRNGMENLHASRINVLREKQAKQLERIVAKQEAELDKAETDFEQENLDLDEKFRDEDESLRTESSQRRERLVRRWELTESIERRKLELETDDKYGKLPDIAWGKGDPADQRRANRDSNWSAGGFGEKADSDIYVQLDESEDARYDPINMI